MPYKPNQVGEEERSRAYPYMWFAAAASPLNLACVIHGVQFGIYGVIWGLTSGGLILAAFGYGADEFLRARLETAMRFVVGAIAIYLAAAWFFNIADLAHSAGYAPTGEESEVLDGIVGAFATDALFVSSVLAVIFYAGYVFAVVRQG
jgi:hypothetical protein